MITKFIFWGANFRYRMRKIFMRPPNHSGLAKFRFSISEIHIRILNQMYIKPTWKNNLEHPWNGVVGAVFYSIWQTETPRKCRKCCDNRTRDFWTEFRANWDYKLSRLLFGWILCPRSNLPHQSADSIIAPLQSIFVLPTVKTEPIRDGYLRYSNTIHCVWKVWA